jgi:hypothetical protein
MFPISCGSISIWIYVADSKEVCSNASSTFSGTTFLSVDHLGSGRQLTD